MYETTLEYEYGINENSYLCNIDPDQLAPLHALTSSWSCTWLMKRNKQLTCTSLHLVVKQTNKAERSKHEHKYSNSWVSVGIYSFLVGTNVGWLLWKSMGIQTLNHGI